jgi:hypothetical protein
MKKLLVVLTLVATLSLLLAGVASANVNWNKWQPITHTVVSGTFKFTPDTWKVKEYTIPGYSADLVGYLTPFESFAEFDNEVYYAECVPQGATIRTTFGKGWIEELTGRDLSDVPTDKIYTCIYPAGWHDAQE